MPVRIPVEATRLEQSIIDQVRSAGRKVGKKGGINLGTSAKSVDALAQPLGRITGKADQFTKSMEAANARVLAFGASVGVLSSVTRGFKELVVTTIQVEKSLASINAIMGASSNELERFKKTIFDVARNTEQSFDTVATAALEFSRQGLKAQEVVARLNDSMVLARLSGLGAGEAVAGLTAAINSFNSTGIKSSEVLNKLSAAAASAAVSERDLIEGIKRSGAVAIQAGVQFDELVGVISSVQEKTARGGAVIGNSFKTIFTRLQSLEKLKTMRNLGVEVTDASGAVHSATQLINNLGQTIKNLPSAERLQIAENLVGKFQVAPFLAILEDMSQETSRFAQITKVAGTATDEAYTRNIALNKTLAAAINQAGVNLKELANTLGEIGVTDSLRNILGFFNNLISGIKNVLEGEGIGSDFARGIVKGIGNIISGPGLAIFGAIIAKLTLDLVKFGAGSIKTFFGLNSAAKQIAQTQGQIAATLLNNKGVQDQILKIENSQLSTEQKKLAQTQFFTQALNTQLATMQRMQAIAARVAPGVTRGTRAAGGYIPNFAAAGYGSEQGAINRGVGGAPTSARPVTIPNFAFGGGQRGTITANSSEYIVPNFAGGGSAIFNQNMVSSMGLPAGAKRVGAAGGYIPNFAKKGKMPKVVNADPYFYLVPDMTVRGVNLGERTIDGQKVAGARAYGLRPEAVKGISDESENTLSKNITNSLMRHTARWVNKLQPLGRKTNTKEIKDGFEYTRGAKGALQGAIGSAFEVGITKALDYRAAAREKGGDFDVRGGTNLSKIKKLFGFPGMKTTGDFKVGLGGDSVISFYKKVIKEQRAGQFTTKGERNKNAKILARQEVRQAHPGLFRSGSNDAKHEHRSTVERLINNKQKEILPRFAPLNKSFRGGGFAGGYIPNFADPLQDAIIREKAAGLPISQIRVNQSNLLRNAGNPMGLAVTNMRDEPSGKIPNYAAAPKGEVSGASGDLMMKFMGLTMAASMLQGMFSQMGEETSNLSKGMSDATQAVMMMAMMAMMGGGKMGFAPLQGGKWAANRMGRQGRLELGGKRTGGLVPTAGGNMNFARVAPTGMARAGAMAKVTGGGALKGLSMFGRFLPVIGQVIFGFQALSGIAKMLGVDLGGAVGKAFKDIGMAIGWIDTPAQKAARALNKLELEAIKTAHAQGVAATSLSDFLKRLQLSSLGKQARAKLGATGVEDTEDLTDKDAIAKLIKQSTDRAAFDFARKDIMEATRFTPTLVESNRPYAATTTHRGDFDFEGTTVTDIEAQAKAMIKEIGEGSVAGFVKLREQVGVMTSFKQFWGVEGGSEEAVLRETATAINKQREELLKKYLDSLKKNVIDDTSEVLQDPRLTTTLTEKTQGALGGLLRASTGLGTAEQREAFKKTADPDTAGARAIEIFETLSLEDQQFILDLKKKIVNQTLDEAEAIEKVTEREKAKKVAVEEGNQAQKIQEALGKARLKNMVDITTLQVKMATEADLEAKTKLALLSTSAKEKAELEDQVALSERKRELIVAQIKATSKLVQEQGMFAQQLTSKNPNETINAAQFTVIKNLVEETNAGIIAQEGYTAALGDVLYENLRGAQLTHEMAQAVVDLVKEENIALEKQSDIQAKGISDEKRRKTILDSRLKTQERILSNLQAELSLQGELNKSTLERVRIDFKIAQLEGKKIGLDKQGALAIEKEITAERKKQAVLDLESAKTRILQDLKRDLFQTAKAAGLDLDQLSSIQQQLKSAKGLGAFDSIVTNIERATKEAETVRIEQATQAKIDSIDTALRTMNAADYFAERVGNTADILAASLHGGDVPAGFFKALEGEGKDVEGRRAFTARKQDLLAQRATATQQGAVAIRDLWMRPDNQAARQQLEDKKNEGLISEEEYRIAIQNLDNAAKEAARIFKTFGDVIRDFFANIEDELKQLQFDRFRQTTPTGLLDNLRATEFKKAQLGIKHSPLSDTGKAMAQGKLDEKKAIRDLEIQGQLSPTHAGAMEARGELGILKEMIVLKDRMIKEGYTLVDIEKELIDLEKKRLEINTSLSATFEKEFVKKESEIARQFNDKFVGAARAFSTELTHGIVDAIAKGGSLKDVLLGAATGFLNTMSKAFMDRAVDNLVSGLFPSGGSIGGAKGGSVRGGSGMKDDVPALLMGGEFVMRKKAVSKYGPRFFEALNTGSIPGMANGGFFLPGTRGQGAISGKRDLLSFATQTATSGRTDVMGGGDNWASVNLEPESGRMTQEGRSMDVFGQRVQDAKREAFGLYVQQLGQDEDRKRREAELKEQKKAQKKAFWRSLGMAALSAGVSWGTGRWAGRRTAGGTKAFTSTPESQADFMSNYAAGGAVPYSAGVDTVPSMLSGGEFVMNSAATQRLGAGNLEAVNAGGGLGGDNGEVLRRLDNIAEASRGETQINITVNSNGSSEEDSQGDAGGKQRGKDLAIRIKDAVKEVIVQEKRLGGMLTG